MAYCSYEEGMFSNQKSGPPSPLDLSFEVESACFHEAGHAAVSYMLGHGCSSLSVSFHPQEDERGSAQVAIGGRYLGAKAALSRVGAALKKGVFAPELTAHSIVTAAGPASERLFRMNAGLPLQLVYGSLGDHEAIDKVAKRLDQSGRSRFAYRRLVWHSAQVLVGRPDVWSAISSLAERLREISDEHDDEEPSVVEYTLPGATARSILRRAGLSKANVQGPFKNPPTRPRSS